MSSSRVNQPSGGRIYPATRGLAAFVIPFLVAALAILFIWPERSGELFAWPIKPPLSAMLLAAAYAGGIYFFSAVLAAHRWHTIKAGFLPVMSFAGLLGIATLIHWDKFNHQHISFYAWAGLYFTAPFLVLAAWLYNRLTGPGAPEPAQPKAGMPWRFFFIILGLTTLAMSLLFIFTPTLVIAFWPWKLTPLTARVMGAMFAMPGILGFEIALDPRLSAARTLVEAQVVSMLFMLVAVLRSRNDFVSPAGFWITLGAILLLVIDFGWFVITAHRKGRRQATPLSG